MLSREIGPMPEIISCRVEGSKLQVTFRLGVPADERALSEIFDQAKVVPHRAEATRRPDNQATYVYEFGSPVEAETAKALISGIG